MFKTQVLPLGSNNLQKIVLGRDTFLFKVSGDSCFDQIISCMIPMRLSMFEPYSRNMFGTVMVKTPLQWFPRDFPLNQFVDSFAGILSMGQSFIETPVDCLDPALDEFHLMPP